MVSPAGWPYRGLQRAAPSAGRGLRFKVRTHSTFMRTLLFLFLSLALSQADQSPRTNLLAVVRGYADAMIEHGRDVYGPQKSGLLLSALDRNPIGLLKVRPAPPGGIRRG